MTRFRTPASNVRREPSRLQEELASLGANNVKRASLVTSLELQHALPVTLASTPTPTKPSVLHALKASSPESPHPLAMPAKLVNTPPATEILNVNRAKLASTPKVSEILNVRCVPLVNSLY